MFTISIDMNLNWETKKYSRLKSILLGNGFLQSNSSCYWSYIFPGVVSCTWSSYSIYFILNCCNWINVFRESFLYKHSEFWGKWDGFITITYRLTNNFKFWINIVISIIVYQWWSRSFQTENIDRIIFAYDSPNESLWVFI